MSALAGLSQQIISAPKNKAPEKAAAKSSGNEFNKDLDKFEKQAPKDRIPASRNKSVESRASTSPEKTITEKRLEEQASKRSEQKPQSSSKSLTKQEAMWAFLDRMNQELGVKPDEVMNAFAQLDVDHLMAPPETSADEFVQNLDLQPGQEEKALNLYSQLLTWTSAASLSEQLQQQGQNADMNVMNSQDYQKQQRMAGLSELSDKFFMNGQHTRDNVLQSRQNLAGMTEQNALSQGGSNIADKLMDMQAAEQKPMLGSTDELLRQMKAEVSKQDEALLNQAGMPQLETQQKMNALKSYGQAQTPQQPVLTNAQNLSQMNMDSMNQSPEDMLQSNSQGLQQQNMSSFADSGEGEPQADLSGGDFASQEAFSVKPSSSTNSDFIVKAPQPTETEMSENIREIINKAKVMVKDGGGEMKLSLRPDGLGNVNLKVNVTGGDVRVEMITASDETRKALEKGLGDLKDNLSLQKLNVEQIKVESAQDAAEKMMEEKQEQAERHFQERFLQDFKNQNGSKWGSALGVNPIGPPESQGLEEDEARVKESSDKSRRLDLVA